MRALVRLFLMISPFFLFSCEESGGSTPDLGFGFQPLEVGLFWEYEVEQTITFGEGDSETERFFLRDRVDYFYTNVQNETVYVVKRERSLDRRFWIGLGNYAIQYRGNRLLRTEDNQTLIALIFPPSKGRAWDAMAFSSTEPDMFEIEEVGIGRVGAFSFPSTVRVKQEQDDDLITFRDNRYEVYARGVGLIEQYYEVLTYCSRNDCLGRQIVDSGRKTHLKLLDYGRR